MISDFVDVIIAFTLGIVAGVVYDLYKDRKQKSLNRSAGDN